MILGSTGDFQPAGARESGKTVLVFQPSASAAVNPAVTLDWDLRARPDSEGRSFALGLPGDDTTELTLDLPIGLIPVGPQGYREGPFPSSSSGFQSWRFQGPQDSIKLRVLDGRKPLPPGEESLIWVSGATRVVLGSAKSRGPSFANWTTEWRVETESRGLVRFTVELDPGLEFLDVSGPYVKDYVAVREAGATRVRVSLADVATPSTSILFKAHARVPLEGSWSVPAMRSLDTVWTGGQTTVVVDSMHIVQDCRERAGRRVPAQAGEQGGASAFVFEARSADSVADLVFRQSLAQPACQVRGRLLVGAAAPELECQLLGIGGRGSPRELNVDLPPAWIADRVRWSGGEESLSWHPTIQANGSTRLHVVLSTGDAPIDGRVLEIKATASIAAGRGQLDLPRVRPVGLTIADDTWMAVADKTMTLTPISAQGLVWIDPTRVQSLLGLGFSPSPDSYTALAWRWNGDNAAARVERERAEQSPRADIQYRATIEQDGKHLDLEGQIVIKAGSSFLEVLPLWISQPAGSLQNWSFQSGPENRELARLALDEPTRSALLPPGNGSGCNLSVDVPETGESRVHFKTRLPWNRRGSIPLILPPKRFLPRGTLLIELPSRMRSDVQTSGLHRLDASVAERLAASWQSNSGPEPAIMSSSARDYLVAHAFTYTEPGGRLDLSTEDLMPGPEMGIIRDACLTTVLHPNGPWLNRLRLLLHADRLADLRFTMPVDSRLVRVQLDGVDIVPVLDDGRMAVALEQGAPGLRYKTLELDYEAAGRTAKPGLDLRPVLPDIGLPCLSFCWDLMTPPCWQAKAYGPDLLPGDPAPATAWPFGYLGVPELPWPGRQHTSRGLRRNAPPARRDLDWNLFRADVLRRMVQPLGFGHDAASC